MDSVNYIVDILKKEESSTLEFRADVDRDMIGRIISSFLNIKGGQLVLGVADNKEVVGVRDSANVASQLESFLIDEIIPTPAVSVDTQSIGNKNVLVISVRQGTKNPYVFQGGVYFRKGAMTTKANSKQLAQLIHQSDIISQRWETKPAIEVELEDIDINEVKNCGLDVIEGGRDTDVPTEPLLFLSKYGLYKNGDFTNAAVLLFGLNPSRYFPQARVRLSVFRSDKAGEHILYDRIFEGNLFKSIRQITDFFDLAYGLSSSFEETDWKRKDKLRFPRSAIREALLNAFIHRDYSSYSSSIAINIYPDKLQIVSYGRLPQGISIKSLSEDHLSIPVNPDIAHIFFLRRWIEKIGRGTVKMIAQCKEQGFRVPIWKVKDNSVIVTFPDVRVPFDYSEGITEGITEGINKLLSRHRTEGINKGISKGISKGITDTVKNTLVDIIKLLIQENKKLRVSEIAKTLDIPDKSIERHIKRLRDINAIVYEGSKRAGGYKVTEELLEISNNKN